MSTETLVIEAVSDKFKNKYSSGSVLAGGQWLQVSSKLNLSDFKKDTQVEVETTVNDKGYKSIVGLVGASSVARVKEAIKTARVKAETSEKPAQVQAQPTNSYESSKNRRILVQGITQAVAQSPALAGLPGMSVEEIAEHVQTLSRLLIAFVDAESAE